MNLQKYCARRTNSYKILHYKTFTYSFLTLFIFMCFYNIKFKILESRLKMQPSFHMYSHYAHATNDVYHIYILTTIVFFPTMSKIKYGCCLPDIKKTQGTCHQNFNS